MSSSNSGIRINSDSPFLIDGGSFNGVALGVVLSFKGSKIEFTGDRNSDLYREFKDIFKKLNQGGSEATK